MHTCFELAITILVIFDMCRCDVWKDVQGRIVCNNEKLQEIDEE